MAVAANPRVTLLWRVVPVVALVALAATWGRDIGLVVVVVVAVVLAAAVLAAVHHAEVVAHRVGEPFGSLVLAVAVTVIEVALIVTLMLSGGDEAATLARDTVFAAVMITVNGILGLSLLLGARSFGTVRFNAEGTGGALATVATLATVCLGLPTVTESRPGPEFTSGQLAFAAVASLALYLAFVVTQTVRHRDFFLPVSFVGVVIALLVLLPETLAAVNAARRDRVQTSLNLALGSAMASIGLTIPTLAVASIWIPTPLKLGLGATQIVLLAITVVVAVLTVVPGRATRLQASVHLTLFAAFLFLAMSP
jgi:Ca2+:H+ antiporter